MKELTTEKIRKFGFVLALIFCFLGAVHFLKKHTISALFFVMGISTFLAAIFSSRVLKPFYLIFSRIAKIIGWVNTRIILILVYYLLLTPIGLLMKCLRKDLLNIKFREKVRTYWIERTNVKASADDLRRQF